MTVIPQTEMDETLIDSLKKDMLASVEILVHKILALNCEEMVSNSPQT